MLEIRVLASGSAGNALLVRSGQTRVLVDAGLSARRLRQRLAACGVEAESLDGIVLTHEHGDHTRGLKGLCEKTDVPIYANRMTAAALQADGVVRSGSWRYFSNGTEFSVGALSIEGFSVPHDAVDPVGFLVRNGDSTFALLTDLGHVTALVADRAKEADVLLVETNYDDELLNRDTRRPWSVKQRIASRHGHLSNAAAAALVEGLAGGRLASVIVGHLSRDCNEPGLAVGAVSAALARCGTDGVEVHCAAQDQVSCPFVGGWAGAIP